MERSAAIALLFAEGDTKREKGSARWTSLRTNDFGRFSHLLPNLNCRRIHIKQSYLLAILPPKTVDADRCQEAHLSGLEQVRSHADDRRIIDVPHFLCAFETI